MAKKLDSCEYAQATFNSRFKQWQKMGNGKPFQDSLRFETLDAEIKLILSLLAPSVDPNTFVHCVDHHTVVPAQIEDTPAFLVSWGPEFAWFITTSKEEAFLTGPALFSQLNETAIKKYRSANPEYA